MNETITVLIGTISGFIIAFFAEPIKNRIENKAKLNNLKSALYKEMFYNYSSLRIFGDQKLNADKYNEDFLLRYALRTECYQHAIQNELSLFYQLSEAHIINVLQSTSINRLINLSADIERIYGKEGINAFSEALAVASKGYQEVFARSCYDGSFDKKVFKKIMSKDQYFELMMRGKEEFEKDHKKEGTL